MTARSASSSGVPDRGDAGDDDVDFDVDPDRLSVCSYWRCGELFERRTANQRYCRKACRSRQNKWMRAAQRRRGRSSP